MFAVMADKTEQQDTTDERCLCVRKGLKRERERILHDMHVAGITPSATLLAIIMNRPHDQQ